MASDARAAAAREAHVASLAAAEQAQQYRELRDRYVRQLRAEDPQRWTYTALASAVGCSPELIAHIVRSPQREA